MLAAEMQMPVAVCALLARIMRMHVHVQPARHRQPSNDEPERDQKASTDELSTLLEPDWNLPAKKQDDSSPQREQHRVADGKTQRESKRACIPGRPERRRQRERGDRHEVIGAKTVEETESEHAASQHDGDYRWLWAVGCGLWAVGCGLWARPKA